MDLLGHWLFELIGNSPVDLTVIAQSVTDTDLLGNIQKSFGNFVQTGQAWALLIGVVIGYIIRNLTSYG
jgi:hypothetical protein